MLSLSFICLISFFVLFFTDTFSSAKGENISLSKEISLEANFGEVYNIEDVEKITISHRLARDTLNVDAGTEFPEILVLNIKLRQSKVNEKLLDALDKSIRSGYVLFMLEYNEKECASISHKTVNAKECCTIDKRWTTD